MDSRHGSLQAVCGRCDDGYIYSTEDGHEVVAVCVCQRRATSPVPAGERSWLGELSGRVTALNEALAVGDTWEACEIGLALETELVAALDAAADAHDSLAARAA
jgi:hypothetical protein